jgi:hypothetical protein
MASVLVGVKVLNSRQQHARQLPLSGLAGNNPASCREKNTPTPEIIKSGRKIIFHEKRTMKIK